MSRSVMLEALPSLPKGIEVNDPNDASLRVMAVEADRLVTGNHHAGLLQHGILGRTRIVTPATFCAEALRCLAKSFLWTKARQSGKRPLLSGRSSPKSAVNFFPRMEACNVIPRSQEEKRF